MTTKLDITDLRVKLTANQIREQAGRLLGGTGHSLVGYSGRYHHLHVRHQDGTLRVLKTWYQYSLWNLKHDIQTLGDAQVIREN